ncbi:unnamed protein product [Ranitomeya imitator]|uniref:MRG domain-containing protein n=1 Tax=Ranitomeya imitator TaxID=111125 RepID=A0ABN9MFA1_9NEOB|nr:unnamed protein product [Ranitomeya imitator]
MVSSSLNFWIKYGRKPWERISEVTSPAVKARPGKDLELRLARSPLVFRYLSLSRTLVAEESASTANLREMIRTEVRESLRSMSQAGSSKQRASVISDSSEEDKEEGSYRSNLSSSSSEEESGRFCLPLDRVDKLVKSVRGTMGLEEPKTQLSRQELMFSGLEHKKRRSFPVIDKIQDLILREWKKPEKKGSLPPALKRRYPFEDTDVDTWDKAPKLDAAVAKASKKAALPFEDMGSLKDPLDRKAEIFLKGLPQRELFVIPCCILPFAYSPAQELWYDQTMFLYADRFIGMFAKMHISDDPYQDPPLGSYAAFPSEDRSACRQGVLRPPPSFLPKVVSTSNEDVVLPSFCPAPTHPLERSLKKLDLVTAVRIYLDRTSTFRKTGSLFVIPDGTRRGQLASKVTIARWIRTAILEAYRVKNRVPPPGIKAHSTRSVGASWVVHHRASVLQLCKAATLSSIHMFAKFYKVHTYASADASLGRRILQAAVLFNLPAKKNVETILEEYATYKKSRGNTDNKEYAVNEVVAGIKEYFNVMLGTQLLYKFERPQYADILADHPDAPMSQVYGAPHLLRLFVRIGAMLSYTPLDEKSLALLLNYLHDFLKYLAKNSSTLFSASDYEVAPPEYHRKAV